MSNTALAIAFFAALGVTVIFLFSGMFMAHKHRIRAHITLVICFVLSLLVTLGFAEALGGRYTFSARSHSVHMPLAYSTAGALLLPLITGVLHWKDKVSLKAHKITVWVFLGLLVLALGTGAWMFTERTPREEAPARGPSAPQLVWPC